MRKSFSFAKGSYSSQFWKGRSSYLVCAFLIVATVALVALLNYLAAG